MENQPEYTQIPNMTNKYSAKYRTMHKNWMPIVFVILGILTFFILFSIGKSIFSKKSPTAGNKPTPVATVSATLAPTGSYVLDL
jgi:hypothetical protein